MKTIIFTIILTISGFANGFDIPDTTKEKNREVQKEQIKEKEQIQEQAGKSDKSKFIDKKGSGDKSQVTQRKRKDVFIDKDGDGICDTRQGGMSFNKLRKRTGQKQGSGSGGGQNGDANQAGYGGGR
ncbi:MAG: hypothetical protein R6W68_06160 [Ignavibacteriaceae bacterium]